MSRRTSDRYPRSRCRGCGVAFHRACLVGLACVCLALAVVGWGRVSYAHPLGFSTGTFRLQRGDVAESALIELELVLDAPASGGGGEGRKRELAELVRRQVVVRQQGVALLPEITVLALGQGAQAEDIVRWRARAESRRALVLSTDPEFGELALLVYHPGSETPRRSVVAAGSELHVEWDDRQSQSALEPLPSEPPVAPGRASPARPAAGESLLSFSDAVTLGFRHILPFGLDHVAFVLGLFLVSAGIVALTVDLTLFTIAHSVTLALGALGWVSVAPTVAEPLIALSICVVGLEPHWERFVTQRLGLPPARLTAFRRGLVFAFGLVHGLGFAYVFARHAQGGWGFVRTLLGFNLGVEFGQLAVVLAALCLTLPIRHRVCYRRRVVPWATALVAALGGFWFLERILEG